jgi:metal-sulfur cluster biosynthetic enzyme
VDQPFQQQAFDAPQAPEDEEQQDRPTADQIGDGSGEIPLRDPHVEGVPGAADTAPTGGGGAPTVDDVMDALSNVIDPELGLDFVELGLIYGVEVQGGNVHVTFTLTTPGCPIGPQVSEQIDEFVGELDGVRNVTSEMVFTPPWSPEKMSEDAKFALGF